MKKVLILIVCLCFLSCGNEVSEQYIQKKYKDYRILNIYESQYHNYYMVICMGDTLKRIEIPYFVYDLYNKGDTIGKVHVAPNK